MTTTVEDTTTSVDAANEAAPLDALLVDGALSSLRRWSPGSPGFGWRCRLATRPTLVSGQLRDLVTELGRVTAGSSLLQPSRKDRRFSDPARKTNPVLRRAVQAYLATGGTLESLVDGADLDWRSEQRMRFLVDNLVAAAAPSNSPLLNPEVRKATAETRGRNLAVGAVNLVKDMVSPPRVPSMVDPSGFEVGDNLGVTPGAVIFRCEVFELIQYTPQTTKVHKFPLVVSPPTINKFYITDLAPGRSMVEHFVKSGQQVFMISWRNPDARGLGSRHLCRGRANCARHGPADLPGRSGGTAGPSCSPGCGPTTWSGTTGSTAICLGGHLRRSTCCTGTLTPPG